MRIAVCYNYYNTKDEKRRIMRKLICLFAVLSLALSLCSCDGAFDLGEGEKTVFYGVGDHITELENTCVFLVGVGHVSMPMLNDGTIPAFKSGDLIEITFVTEGNGIAIMESYPARFADRASEIKVISADVKMEYQDDGYRLVMDIPDNIADAAVGDRLICDMPSGEGIACEIENIDGEKMSVKPDTDMSDLIRCMIYSNMSFSVDKKNNNT